MQFRILTSEELESFKEEFVKFLIIQGIDAQEWLRIKGDEPVKAVKILEVFSDFIFESIVNKVKYISYFDRSALRLFKCEELEIHLVNISCGNDFETIELMLASIHAGDESFEIQRVSKAYQPDRNTEIFRMIQAGGLVSDGHWFDYFNKTSFE